MFKKIELPDAEGKMKEVEFLANAATPRRFKTTFRADLITKFANAKVEVDGRETYDIDFLPELAYIMAMQAEAKSNEEIKLDKLNYNTFMDWLEGFDSMALENAADEIISVYMGNTEQTSDAKKNIEEQKEK